MLNALAEKTAEPTEDLLSPAVELETGDIGDIGSLRGSRLRENRREVRQ